MWPSVVLEKPNGTFPAKLPPAPPPSPRPAPWLISAPCIAYCSLTINYNIPACVSHAPAYLMFDTRLAFSLRSYKTVKEAAIYDSGQLRHVHVVHTAAHPVLLIVILKTTSLQSTNKSRRHFITKSNSSDFCFDPFYVLDKSRLFREGQCVCVCVSVFVCMCECVWVWVCVCVCADVTWVCIRL